jgi:multidrug resistance efflux pump
LFFHSNLGQGQAEASIPIAQQQIDGYNELQSQSFISKWFNGDKTKQAAEAAALAAKQIESAKATVSTTGQKLSQIEKEIMGMMSFSLL